MTYCKIAANKTATGFITHADWKLGLIFSVFTYNGFAYVKLDGPVDAMQFWMDRNVIEKISVEDFDAAVKASETAGINARIAEIDAEKTALNERLATL